MANPLGQAAKFALTPAALIAYLDAKSELKVEKRVVQKEGREPYVVQCKVKYINGKPFDRVNHARVLRRWRRHTTGVTERAATALLEAYGLGIPSFRKWCSGKDHKAVAWDNRK